MIYFISEFWINWRCLKQLVERLLDLPLPNHFSWGTTNGERTNIRISKYKMGEGTKPKINHYKPLHLWGPGKDKATKTNVKFKKGLKHI